MHAIANVTLFEKRARLMRKSVDAHVGTCRQRPPCTAQQPKALTKVHRCSNTQHLENFYTCTAQCRFTFSVAFWWGWQACGKQPNTHTLCWKPCKASVACVLAAARVSKRTSLASRCDVHGRLLQLLAHPPAHMSYVALPSPQFVIIKNTHQGKTQTPLSPSQRERRGGAERSTARARVTDRRKVSICPRGNACCVGACHVMCRCAALLIHHCMHRICISR
jgi:hypothetical protein